MRYNQIRGRKGEERRGSEGKGRGLVEAREAERGTNKGGSREVACGGSSVTAALSLQVSLRLHALVPQSRGSTPRGMACPGCGQVFCPGDSGTTPHFCSLVPKLSVGASGFEPTVLGRVSFSRPHPCCSTTLPPGDMWQCLETFLIVPTREVVLASSGQRPGMRLSVLQCSRRPSVAGIIRTKMSVVLSLRNPGLPPGGVAGPRAQKTALAHRCWAISVGHDDSY